MILTETFQNPKPIIGVLSLLATPGSSLWDGDPSHCLARLEQEVTALASARVDGILLELDWPPALEGNTSLGLGAACVSALTLAVERAARLSHLPIGLAVKPNQAEVALAVAMMTPVRFIRVPLLFGALVTQDGLLEGCRQRLIEVARQLKVSHQHCLLMVDVSMNAFLPGNESLGNASRVNASKDTPINFETQLATWQSMLSGLLEPPFPPDALVFSGAELAPYMDSPAVQKLWKQFGWPVLLDELQPEPQNQMQALYENASGLFLRHGIRKQTPQLSPSSQTVKLLEPTIDMHRVEKLVSQLRKTQSLDQMDADIFVGDGN